MNANVRAMRSEELEAMCDLVARSYAEKRHGSVLPHDTVIRAIAADPEFDTELNRVVAVDGKLVARYAGYAGFAAASELLFLGAR